MDSNSFLSRWLSFFLEFFMAVIQPVNSKTNKRKTRERRGNLFSFWFGFPAREIPFLWAWLFAYVLLHMRADISVCWCARMQLLCYMCVLHLHGISFLCCLMYMGYDTVGFLLLAISWENRSKVSWFTLENIFFHVFNINLKGLPIKIQCPTC